MSSVMSSDESPSLQVRPLTKRVTKQLVRDIWRMKEKYDSQRRTTYPMSDYLFEFLRVEHNTQHNVSEIGYNFLNALQR